MRRIKWLLVALVCCVVLSAAGYVVHAKVATKVFTVDKTRTVKVVGPVDGKVLKAANKLVALSNKSKAPIHIVLNSPGGMVLPGMQFLNAMKMVKSKGIELVCIVPVFAASMAYHIFSECDKRITMEYSLLLWHPMRISFMFASLTAEELEAEAKVIRMYEKPLNERLIKSMNVSSKFYYYHYNNETFWTAIALREKIPSYFKIVDRIEGVDKLFTIQ